jgi:hypothetical protein
MSRRNRDDAAKPAGKTPVRLILKDESSLQALVKDGLGGVTKKADKNTLDESIRNRFSDSLALDDAMKADKQYKQVQRWDYLLGDAETAKVIALEPHSAHSDQVTKVILKRTRAREQLAPHLRPGVTIAAWLWVASDKVGFPDTDKVRRRLDQSGITFVGERVLKKHLPT